MATGHWFTNKGRLWVLQGGWDDSAAGEVKVGLLQSPQPAGLDTAVEVADINFITDFLAAGAVLCTATSYAPVALSRTNATEDDANDRVNMDSSDVAFGAIGGTLDNVLAGHFFYYEGGGTDATRGVISVEWWAATKSTNGGTFSITLADVYRAA